VTPQRQTLGQVRQELAELGTELAAGASMITYERPTGTHDIVIVERVRDLRVAPTYCVHGFASCLRCNEWCYLGSETKRVVLSGQAYPLCIVCGPQVIPEGRTTPTKRVFDHPRHIRFPE
jgi:hypothetical protein